MRGHSAFARPLLFSRASWKTDSLIVGIRYGFHRLCLPSISQSCFSSREDPARIWERRAPLTPDAVHKLTASLNVKFHILPCARRVFSNIEYVKVCSPFCAFNVHKYPAVAYATMTDRLQIIDLLKRA
jgi:hypothetical protein